MWIAEFQYFMNREFNCGIMWFFTDIAGLTMMMTSATIRVHYVCINKCARLAQKSVRINS